MPRQFALAALLSGSALAQTHAPVRPRLQQLEQLDEIRGRQCEVPEGFGCGILFDLDLPESGNMNLSVVGTVVYDPPVEGDDKFSSLRRYGRIPARIDGNYLTIEWPDKTKAKGRIVRREKIEPERPWPA
jgi:hypothetical protein